MRTILAAIALITLSAGAFAQPTGQFVEGTHFERVSDAPSANTDGIEVLEVFSYGCPHCVSMQPHLKAWLASKPAQVKLNHMPATFRPDFELYARGYYAAESIGLLAQTHERMFALAEASHGKVRNIDDLAGLYAELGVDGEKLKAVGKSFAVDMRIREVNQRLPKLKVSFTPSFIVAGKYRVKNEALHSPAEIFAVIDFLIAKERAEH